MFVQLNLFFCHFFYQMTQLSLWNHLPALPGHVCIAHCSLSPQIRRLCVHTKKMSELSHFEGRAFSLFCTQEFCHSRYAIHCLDFKSWFNFYWQEYIDHVAEPISFPPLADSFSVWRRISCSHQGHGNDWLFMVKISWITVQGSSGKEHEHT